MRRLILLTIFTLTIASNALAQRVLIGEKAPEIKTKAWGDSGKPSLNNTPYIIHFFILSNQAGVDMLSPADDIAKKHKGKINVVVMSRDEPAKVKESLKSRTFTLFIGFDDENRTYTTYNIKFVPYSVLVDAKGRVVWCGNTAQLTTSIIEKVL